MPPARWLNLELQDSTKAPLSLREYVLILCGPPGGANEGEGEGEGADPTELERREGNLDHEGKLHERIPQGVARVYLQIADRRFELMLDEMPEVDTVEGVQERLNHLNYFVGRTDGELGRFTRQAVERFQRDHELSVTGRVDEATVARLRKEYGA